MRSEGRTRGQRAFRLAIRHFAAQLWEDRRVSLPALVIPSIGSILVWFCPPLVVAAMIERLGDGDQQDAGSLGPYILAFVAVWAAGEMTWRIGLHFLNRAISTGTAKLTVRALDLLFAKDLAFFQDSFAGALTKKVVGYGQGYDMVLATLVFQVMPSTLPVVFVAVVLGQYSPWLVVALLGMVTLTLVAVWPLIVRRQKLVNAREAASVRVAGHVADAITNIDAVRLFARERTERGTHARNVEEWRALALRSWDYQNRRIDLVTSPFYVATNALGVWLAIDLAASGRISVAEVFVVFTFYIRFTYVIWQFNEIYRNIESHLSIAAQFTDLLLDPPTVNDPDAPATPRFRDSSVGFGAITFRHAGRSEPLFRGLDLRIPPGQKVGLVGPSGGGKSTLIRLLLRVADLDAGAITIGGQDISRIRQADLRDQIAYVPQDPLMFHRSLRDNIAFGRLDATDAEIRAAAAAANATAFVESLPQGFETLVGERGVKLSGGQRQRIAIARAILRDAPILVLDEATSSLDSESEGLIQEALHSLMAERTAIVIAHRLSTVQAMDRLVVLDDGEIVEDGTHAELLAAGGLYAGLWRQQSSGFLALRDDGRHEGVHVL